MKWAVYQTERAWEAERGEVAYVSSMRGSVRAASRSGDNGGCARERGRNKYKLVAREYTGVAQQG